VDEKKFEENFEKTVNKAESGDPESMRTIAMWYSVPLLGKLSVVLSPHGCFGWHILPKICTTPP
jgi:hypothetical protein